MLIMLMNVPDWHARVSDDVIVRTPKKRVSASTALSHTDIGEFSNVALQREFHVPLLDHIFPIPVYRAIQWVPYRR